jgi:DNA-binding transcriptional LysR family regulator
MYQKLLSQSGFSMERLASFCAMADAGSIAGAAKDDPVRQSLISRQIRELESFFGVALVRRKGRGLELTESGLELAAIGRENFKGLSDFSARCDGSPWSVRIVTSNSVAHWLLLPKLKNLPSEMKNVRFEIHHEQTRESVTTTREGVYDIAFVREEALDAGFSRLNLGVVGSSLLLPKSLVKKKPKDVDAALSSAPLALPVGGKLRDSINDSAAQKGIPLQVAVGCASYLQAYQLMESGMCAAVLPDLALPTIDLQEYHRFPIAVPYTLCLAWSTRNADTRPALGRLIQHLGQVLQIEK